MNTQLKTLMLAFVGIPIMTHIVALVLLTLFDLINSICNGMNDEFNSPEKSFLLCGVLLLGGLMMFVEGAVWGKRCSNSALNTPLRYCLMLLPALLLLIIWIVIISSAHQNYSYNTYADFLFLAFPWWGVNLYFLISGWAWGMLIIPICSQILFTLGYYIAQHRNIFPDNAQRGRNIITAVILVLILIAAWQAKLRADDITNKGEDNGINKPESDLINKFTIKEGEVLKSRNSNLNIVRKVALLFMLLISTSSFAKNPCAELKGVLPEAQVIPFKKNIARQLSSEMSTVVDVNKLQILNYFELDKWSLVYVFTDVSDEAILIYKDNIVNADYVTLFSGGVSIEDDMNQWIHQQTPDIPDRLAQCFIWFATYRTDFE
ncbi:TPA: hypothetical protein ACN607_002891 [Escherichia albertii]|nr:hypothetical protein [Escherichia albertii]